MIAALAAVKFRSRNSPNGINGSRRFTACQATKPASTTIPVVISPHTDTGMWVCRPPMARSSVIRPHAYVLPSWMPNTTRNVPTELSTTPSQSKLWECTGSFGTRRTAATNPMTPIGTFTKKIHSQPNASVSRPPSSGPTSIATPAVAPHSDIAWARCFGGNSRVITAIVCGDISAAPRPCTTRQVISEAAASDRPQASEARVKTARPVR